MYAKTAYRTTRAALFAAAALLSTVPALQATANIVVVNIDGANEGFNDPTAAAPVGGNPGTTIGQQRLIAFQFAAATWGAKLDSPVTIYIQAAFNPLSCTPTGAVLGAAAAIQVFANFPNREFDNIWYPAALVNKLAGADLAPGPNGSSADDIQAIFNSNLGAPGCLTGRHFYYGLDNNHGTDIDLVAVLLHEFGHGLGFANVVTESTGTSLLGLGDIFSQFTRDTTTGKNWNQMTVPERAASAKNTRRVIWDGIHTTAAVPSVLLPGTPLLAVNTPTPRDYAVGQATFGPALSSPGVTANVVLAADAVAPSADACTPLVNVAAIAGHIALIDRRVCSFAAKVKNAQNAGAVAVIIADNASGSPPATMTGVDPTIVIPAVRVSVGDGFFLKSQLPSGTVNATIGIDMNVRQGATRAGFAMLYMPDPVVSGSSGSHFDSSAVRNLLMEPSINTDLTHSLEPPEDLTLKEMVDIGWFSDGDGVPDGIDQCIGSDRSATVVIEGCDSTVTNTTFISGCRISDGVQVCAANARNHGGFQSCISQMNDYLAKTGVISGVDRGKISACAAKSSLP